RSPGFLIGGVPANFGITARYGDSPFFVVEADEYDTAFFDKRAKFVHYRPRTLVLNNIEFDHADIYTDLEAILWQFHQLIRTVPGNGRILLNAGDRNLRRLLEMGCWTETENFGLDDCADWRASFSDAAGLAFCASNGADRAETGWQLSGDYNLENAIAAIAAAHSAGVPLDRAVDAMSRFSGVKRRLERTDEVAGIFVYDDFAHHPTAIRRTIEGMKARYPGERLFIALELRSNTMKLGVHNDTLAAALSGADHVAIYRPDDAGIALDASVAELGDRLSVYGKYGDMLSGLRGRLLPGDHLVFMSNGGFGAVRERLTAALKAAL
ncbi:MAG: UDP-N-acetylmuramate:L-alanyl-gamma-D-glutamyl-meso-diaminopimelate ligase, partial [Halioglobus sp.]|nr:UDP-N-acetylmuramate:L-alanyl-gamma-D-glutamyl-meso-diaminopimelate ligase [Halioglobus sp.]